MTATLQYKELKQSESSTFSIGLNDENLSSLKVDYPLLNLDGYNNRANISSIKPSLSKGELLDIQPRESDVKSTNVTPQILRLSSDLERNFNYSNRSTVVQRLIPLSTLNSWQLNTLRAISKLSKLPEDWDGYGSPKIKPEALKTAFDLVLAIEIKYIPTCHVYPVPGGGIQLEWQNFNRELEIEILHNGAIEFLTVAEDEEMEEGSLSLGEIDEVRNLLFWLIGK